ncbi:MULTISPECIES: Uma2 family endonuclease [Nostocales]|uniref:Uma2 family endonuclease n=2 Tax=Dolichospermum TaxID=748770 RepID=A0ACC7SC41_DOLFA|nr:MULTISPECIES: Uma2 family endonuclease [Nostocales]MBO1065488.1 Uma2 family endonuclease [Anabaena sp. 54]MTJ45047.1 Uma2 family endonuclease [Dolichospermum flos-aquae UHCC 0037]UUO16886.1 Uma2 family endonuclease [Dolichospermum heterosporum TAC447]
MALTAQEIEALMPDCTELLSDEPEMESSLHYTQLLILVTCLEWLWRNREDFFIGANLSVYYSRQQLKNRDFRGPDFFLVKDTEKRPRLSWVIWEEDGKYPNVIIELLSDSTAKVDKGLKKQLYQNQFRTPEYFWFSPNTLELVGWRLTDSEYKTIPASENAWYWSQELGLYLGVWEDKLRYFTVEGRLVPTPEEANLEEMRKAEVEYQRAEVEYQRAESERQKVEVERQRADDAENKAAILAQKLRELGIEPDSL